MKENVEVVKRSSCSLRSGPGLIRQSPAELGAASGPHTMYWYTSALPWSGAAKGLSQAIENGCPNTTFMFIHFDFLAHFLSSFFSCSMPCRDETDKREKAVSLQPKLTLNIQSRRVFKL